MPMDMTELNLVKEKAFAVVQLKPGSEIKLLKILIENGYTNVSFTNTIGDMVDVNSNEEENVEIDVEGLNENEDNDLKITNNDRDRSNESTRTCFVEELPNESTINPLTGKELTLSSLTLPTVLWPGPKQTSFYNPFLANPFLPSFPAPPPTGGQSDLTNCLRLDIPPLPPHANVHSPSPTWNHHQQQQGTAQVLDTPPSTPRGSSNESSCLITGAKLRQRGRQLRRNEKDCSSYASCRLCRNRILANRLSNLHNHVRRHAVMKQFHCCYCSYAHTEVAKVRLHMLHNHKDDHSQPLDKRNEDMEAAWSLLMKECFPGYV